MTSVDTVDFVIFACPRTGSNHLCATLTTVSGIVCHHEVFHPDGTHLAKVAHVKGLAASEAIDAVATKYDPSARNRHPWGFLADLKAATKELKVGFKIFPHQPDESDSIAHELCSTASIKKIVLHRSNALAAFSSLKIANMRDTYFQDGSSTLNPTAQLPFFDPAEFEKYASDYDKWYKDIMARIIAARSTFFFFPYEMINSKEMILGLATWIGVPAATLHSTAGHVKTGAIDVAARFHNSKDVLSLLSTSNRMHWRYDIASS